MPRIRKRAIKKSTRVQHKKLSTRIKLKTKNDMGGIKMINVVEKKNQVTYSTSHILE